MGKPYSEGDMNDENKTSEAQLRAIKKYAAKNPDIVARAKRRYEAKRPPRDRAEYMREYRRRKKDQAV
jgi:hypothetical protein